MRLVLMFFLLITGLLPAAEGRAVTVGIWQTGMTRQQVWDLAREKNIAIAPEGRLHAASGFQERFLDPQARTWYCRGRYVDHDATFYLHLADVPGGEPVVRAIEVRYAQGFNSAVTERIVRTLTQKYGRAETRVSSWQSLARWQADNLLIELEVRKNRTRLTFTDLTLQQER
ncbi:MAG: hypothetical protein D6794_09615 [Deltaproteobacteria bacterium]|nr:MAG: hypothetical protein D6794_09615 [Deltaproteobacteria bacterium]